MPRLFVAIDLPDPVRDRLEALQQADFRARWVRRQQMHLTLHFIGEAAPAQQQAIQAALKTVRGRAFSMALRGTGQFPPSGKPRVLWAGVDADETLTELHQAIGAALQTTGCRLERRPFTPHITLARFRQPPAPRTLRAYQQQHQEFATAAFPVEQFVLYSSQLTPQGAIYRHEGVYPLEQS